jgi:hypothetical protein
MRYSAEDLENQSKFTLLIRFPLNDMLKFVLEYLRKKSTFMILTFWTSCALFFVLSVVIRISISGTFRAGSVIMHSILGLIVFPVLIIPVHEALHIIPYYLFGARNIKIGIDLKQYLFYVTAHKFVADRQQFMIVALFPFVLINLTLLILIILLPPLWKWSLSIFIFIHTTACAGDLALLNFYFLNKDKDIYTWDDAEKKITYFYEKKNLPSD